jgi:hypothetical protein
MMPVDELPPRGVLRYVQIVCILIGCAICIYMYEKHGLAASMLTLAGIWLAALEAGADFDIQRIDAAKHSERVTDIAKR